MPLAGYTCPSGAPTAGQRNAGIEHCIAPAIDGGCAHKCIAPPLLKSMWSAEHSNHHVGGYISASMLASESCARQTFYERNYPFWESPRRRFWPFRGTIIHGLVERSDTAMAPLGWLQELRMGVKLAYPDLPAPIFDAEGHFTGRYHQDETLVIEVGGTTDGLNYRTDELIDFKSMSDKKLEGFFAGKDGGELSTMLKDTHIWQLNIYAWLVSKTKVASAAKWFDRHGITPPDYEYFRKPTRLQLQYITMMEIPLSGESYTPLRSSTIEVAEVPLLDDAVVEAFVREKALEWFGYLRLGQEPGVVSKSKKWMCVSCPFNGDLLPGERCHPKAEWEAAA